MPSVSSGLAVHHSGMNFLACLKFFSSTDSIVSLVLPISSPQAQDQQGQGKFRESQQCNNLLLYNKVVGVETATPPGIQRHRYILPPAA